VSAIEPTPKPSIVSGATAANAVLAFIVAVVGTAFTWGAIYGGLTGRLGSVEAKVAAEKTEREQSVSEIKLDTVSKDRYEADTQALKLIVADIAGTVKEIRRDQIEDLRRRAESQER
jgi:hypothetical protein